MSACLQQILVRRLGLYTLCLYHHSQFHLLDFDVVGERKEAAQG